MRPPKKFTNERNKRIATKARTDAMLQSNWAHQAPLAVQEGSRSGDNNDEGLCSWGPSLCSLVIDCRIGKSRCGSSDRSWLRTGIEQRVEEELISHFRL